MSEKKETSIVIVDQLTKITEDSKQLILNNTIGSPEKMDKFIAQFSKIEIKDKSSYDMLIKASKDSKKSRGAMNKNRTDITRPVVAFQKDMIAFVETFTDKLTAFETEINEKIKTFENIEKAKAEKLFAERCQLLAKNGFTMVSGNYQCGAVFLSPEQIQDFNDEDFNFHIEIGKQELKRQEVEKQRKAEEAAVLAKEREEIAQMKADMVKMKAEFKADMEKEREEIAKDRKSVDAEIERLNPVQVPKMENPPKPPIQKTADKIDKVIAPVEKPVEKLPTKQIVDKYKLGRQDGFNEFRKQMASLMASDAKFTRPQLIEWVNTLELIK